MGFLLNVFSGPYAMVARIGLYVLVIVGAITFGWIKGNAHGTAKLDKYIGEQAVATANLIIKQGKETVRVVNHYIKVRGATETVTKTIEKEVIRYAKANPGSCLDPAWRVRHDAAAANAIPAGGFEPDGEVRAPATDATQ